MAVWSVVGAVVGTIGYAFGITEPFRIQGMQETFKQFQTNIPTQEQLQEMYQRNIIGQAKYVEHMQKMGFTGEWQEAFTKLRRSIPNESVLITAFRRGIIKQEDYFSRMADYGWTADLAGMLLETTMFIPPPTDLISWQAKEVFEPDKIAKYGLEDGFDKIDMSTFDKAGVSQDIARKYWVAHWDHPSWTQVQRFRHYANAHPEVNMTDDDVYDWFNLVEVPEYWRNKFIGTLYDPLTRVDVRRMWDLGVLDDNEVIKAYLKLGYNHEDAENLMIFTRLERRSPELRERYKNGWISADEVMAELQSLDLKEPKLTRVFQRIVKAEKDARMGKEKDLTKTEIVNGVKREILTVEQAMGMLKELGYDDNESKLILQINRAIGH